MIDGNWKLEMEIYIIYIRNTILIEIIVLDICRWTRV